MCTADFDHTLITSTDNHVAPTSRNKNCLHFKDKSIKHDEVFFPGNSESCRKYVPTVQHSVQIMADPNATFIIFGTFKWCYDAHCILRAQNYSFGIVQFTFNGVITVAIVMNFILFAS